MYNEKKISVIILSAGLSARMKMPKAFLKYNEHATFIEKITDTYIEFGCNKIIIVLNHLIYPEFIRSNGHYLNESNIEIVTNERPDNGRFYSIKKAAVALGKTDYCFIQNVDNPFVKTEILYNMLHSIDDSDYYVPTCHHQGGHPVLINGKIIESIIKTEDFHQMLNIFLRKFKKKNIETHDNSILNNINTIHDYKKYLQC